MTILTTMKNDRSFEDLIYCIIILRHVPTYNYFSYLFNIVIASTTTTFSKSSNEDEKYFWIIIIIIVVKLST